MLLAIPLERLRCDLEDAFKELVVGCDYTSDIPNIERLHKFLTKVKDKDESGKFELPENWLYIQFKRNALIGSTDQDYFRNIRVDNQNNSDEDIVLRDDWGFATTELEFWMSAGNSETIELAEALFYSRVFDIRSIRYRYLNLDIKSRVVHESLQTYQPLEEEQSGTIWTTTWNSTLYVPFLKRENKLYKIKEEISPAISLYQHGEKLDMHV